MRYPRSRVSFAGCSAVLILLGLVGPGCGTDLNNALYQSLAATGRTALDLALTQAANVVADAADGLATPPDGADQGAGGDAQDGNGADSGGGDGGGTDGGTTPAGDGDAANGRLIFEANGCSTCHCDDASGGCALGAPSIQGVEVALVTEKLTGVISHTGGTRDLADTELADLAAYLTELAGGGSDPGGTPDSGSGGDPTAGQALFEANGCRTCHCDDASGGCALGAPSIQGVQVALVTDKLTGVIPHTGGTRDLADTELTDLAAYLADLAGGGAADPGSVGDPESGRVLYEDNGCGSCHCADGSGGCALSAPAITGATTTVLDDFLRGSATHTGGKKDLSDGGIASLAAFLAGG